MNKFSLYETAADLKVKLRVSTFFGEASFKPSANICKGDLIPVLRKNENNETYLHSMKWGTNLFSDTDRNLKQLTHQARSEKLIEKKRDNPWLPLIEKGQKCVIIAKGFYFNQYTEVRDVNKQKTYNDKQPFYVEPYIPSEGHFFYIAALYRIQTSWKGRKHSVVAITKSSQSDHDLNGYVQRIPFLLRPKDIETWLNPNIPISHLFNMKYKIRYQQFKKIGLWIDDNSIKDESLILRSREEWDFDQNAKIMGFDDADFPFDEIEAEALKQNSAKKNGIDYQPKQSWDEFRYGTPTRNQNGNDNDNGNDYSFDDDDDGELKQEEYTQTDDGNNDKNKNLKKRKRDEIGAVLEPPNKKQRIEDVLNEIGEDNEQKDNGNEAVENQYSFADDSDTSNTDNNYHTKPIRRESMRRKSDGNE